MCRCRVPVQGYTGSHVLCCVHGRLRRYYRDNTECLACPSSVPLSLAFGSILVFGIAFCIAKYGRYFQGLGMPRIVVSCCMCVSFYVHRAVRRDGSLAREFACVCLVLLQGHWALVITSVSSFNFQWPTVLIEFMKYLRNTFSFMSLTLFRPECEIDVPYIYRWIIRILTPLLLIYIVWVVSALHSIVACYLFSRNKRYAKAPVNIAMCELGVCSNFVTHYLRDPATMEYRFVCEVCAISQKYRPVVYSSKSAPAAAEAAGGAGDAVVPATAPAADTRPVLETFPIPAGLSFGSMSTGQRIGVLMAVLKEDIANSRRAVLCLVMFFLLLLAAFGFAAVATLWYLGTGDITFSPYVVATVAFVVGLATALALLMGVGVSPSSTLASEIPFFGAGSGGRRICGTRWKAMPVLGGTIRWLRIIMLSVALAGVSVCLLPTVLVALLFACVWPLRYVLYLSINVVIMAAILVLLVVYKTALMVIGVCVRGVLYGVLLCVCGRALLEGGFESRPDKSPKVVLARLWHTSELLIREPTMWSGVLLRGNLFLWTLTRLLFCWTLRRPSRFHKLHVLARSIPCVLWRWLVGARPRGWGGVRCSSFTNVCASQWMASIFPCAGPFFSGPLISFTRSARPPPSASVVRMHAGSSPVSGSWSGLWC
jgi:hypothetical protein